MEMRDDFVSRTIKTQKMFNLMQGNCYYVNIELTKKNQKSGQDSKVGIVNHVCKEKDSSLLKVTEVRFGNRIIYIEDSYNFQTPNLLSNISNIKNSSAPTNSSDGSQNNNSGNSIDNTKNTFGNRKRKLIFKKKICGENSNHRVQKRNTKNIAKNFCKAFMTYLEEQREITTFSKTKELVSEYNYNNKVIQKMATDETINKHFKQFLLNKAEQWINSSKIHDKQIHIEAIKLYLQLIQNGINSIQDSDELYEQSQKSLYHSDENFEGSEQDNGRQNSQK